MNKRTDWNELKAEMTSLSREDWDEIAMKVKAVGEAIGAGQEGYVTQRAYEGFGKTLAMAEMPND
jgi:hypothetical protein